MIPDPGYTDYLDPRLAPPEERDPTPAEYFEGCVHSAACHRVLELFEGAVNTDRVGWLDDLAARLSCGECDEWSDR